ncbi:MAG: hypothetical protein J5666_02375 [Bacilli bacterium]|nr:hypothetical protein [Bacilli bacterium]
MNSRSLKSNKKKKISAKTFVFWGCIAAAVLVLVVIFIIASFRSKDIRSFDSLDYVEREGIFNQEEKEYYVLFYDYAGEKRMEEFDNVVLKYMKYVRNNAKATKIYGADLDEYSNKLLIYDGDPNIEGTTTYPGNTFVDSFDSSVLRFSIDDTPLLVVVKEKAITKYYSGETEIKEFLSKLTK